MAQPPFKPAKRSLGQNFLVDHDVTRRIVASLGDISGQNVVEIGPGRGALTQGLIDGGAKLTLVEKDTEMAQQWRYEIGVVVIEADFLNLDVTGLPTPAKLIGNLPYNVSTAILERVAENRHLFSEVVFMFQREVADRIVAGPSTKERGYLSVISQAAFDVERLFDVAPEAFRPAPKVWSTVVRLRPTPAAATDDPRFRRLVSISFRQKRKTLANNLKADVSEFDAILDGAQIDGRRRAETLSLDEWLRLHNALNP